MPIESANNRSKAPVIIQPVPAQLEKHGYQPQSSVPLDPQKLTPPKGDSAIQPPPTAPSSTKK